MRVAATAPTAPARTTGGMPAPAATEPKPFPRNLFAGSRIARVDAPGTDDFDVAGGKLLGSAAGYGSVEDAVAALAELTAGRRPSAMVMAVSPTRFVGVELRFGRSAFDFPSSTARALYDLNINARAIVDGPSAIAVPADLNGARLPLPR